ncbi:preprotein translocase subunit SecG [Parvibaculum indicum]|uniref:preprotein translocase subunit SecG n=1 Tax=Parvibaculum indicum TaxID=562969 RepID=UPI0014207948|nr:preprotein translocase subunit SecG [Parvibaculum indicum]NIJ42740.1 preprotein translocase subunit SecG [Parvibaculum indicum]
MATILLIIHLMIAVALVAVVLLQRSEGGALGIGGDGGGFMSGRGAGSALTRATAFLAGLFFLTSLGLGILATYSGSGGSILDNIAPPPETAPGQTNDVNVPAPVGSGLTPAPESTGDAVTPPAASDEVAPPQAGSGEGAAQGANGTAGEAGTPTAPANEEPSVPQAQ